MRTCATAVVMALLAVWLAVSAQAAELKTDAARIRELVKALGADDFQTRERAQEQLAKIGPPAIPALEKALAETSDPEVKFRAGQLLPDLRKQAAKLLADKIKENVLWTVAVPQAGSGRLIAAGGCVLITGADGRITAVDTATHKVRWEKPAHKDVLPMVLGDTVCVVHPDGKLGAIDLKTGKPQSGFKSWALAGTPALAGGVIYAPGSDKTLRALDGRTGEARWQADIGEVGGFGPAPAVGEGIVAASLGGGRILAVDRATGKALWKLAIGSEDARALAVSREMLFVRLFDRVYGVDVDSGKTCWSTQIGAIVAAVAMGELAVINGQLVTLPPQTFPDGPGMAVADGTVCLAGAGKLLAVDARTGRRKWSRLGDDDQGQADHRKAVNLPGGLGNAQVRIQIQIQGGPVAAGGVQVQGLSEPLADGQVLYYGSPKGLRAADRATGKSLWFFEAPGGVPARPVIADGVIYFAAAGENGQAKLYAVGLKEAKLAARPAGIPGIASAPRRTSPRRCWRRTSCGSARFLSISLSASAHKS